MSKLEATIYSEENFSGKSQTLKVGEYDVHYLHKTRREEGGIGNDNLSSLRVPNGLKVTIYEHGSNSRNKVFTSDAATVGNLNNGTSYIKVERIAVLEATIYSGGNFSGKSQKLAVGEYDIDVLKSATGIGNDTLSSLKVPNGLKVTLYEHGNFRGRTKVFTGDVASVAEFNDGTSSIKVENV